MLKILLVYYEPQPSGQTAHVLSLARGLDPGRFQVTVVLPQRLTGAIPAFQQAGVRVVPLPLRKLAWPPKSILALAGLARSHDIVHVHSQEAGLVARTVARLAGARAILYTPQTVDIRQARWQGLYRRIERTLAAFTHQILSVSESDRQRLIDWGIPARKVVTIPNGIDLTAFQGPIDVGSLRQKLGFDPDRPLILQVGRLSAQKDPLAFVEGARLVAQELPDTQFALVGEGPLRAEVAARIQALGLESHVRLLGWCEGAARFMAAADLVTLTSRWEGLPYALLEAMAWSRPVVSTAVNGCPEVVLEGQSGYLVSPGDVAAWAQAVLALLRDPAQAAAMGQRGRQRVAAHLSLEQMVGRVSALYRHVLS